MVAEEHVPLERVRTGVGEGQRESAVLARCTGRRTRFRNDEARTAFRACFALASRMIDLHAIPETDIPGKHEVASIDPDGHRP